VRYFFGEAQPNGFEVPLTEYVTLAGNREFWRTYQPYVLANEAVGGDANQSDSTTWR